MIQSPPGDVNSGELTTAVTKLEERIDNHIKFFWTVTAFAFVCIAGIATMLYQMNGEVGKLRLPQRLSQTADKPADSNSQSEVRKVLAAARKNSVPIPPIVIEQAGKRFVAAAKQDPSAWHAALDLVSYRSTLNEDNRPDITPADTPSGVSKYTTKRFDDKPPVLVRWNAPIVKAADGAQWDLLGRDLNEGNGAGPSWLTATGGATDLDGVHLKQVVLVGVEVHYSGKPLVLDNVLFINCTFVFDNTDLGRKLADQLLASARISFQSTA